MQCSFFCFLLSLASSLKLGPISPLRIYQDLIFYERISVLLHSVNLSRSARHMLVLMGRRDLPLQTIYDRSCGKWMGKERFEEILRLGLDWKILANPNCMVRVAELELEGIDWTTYPSSVILSSSDTDVTSKSLIYSEIIRLAGMMVEVGSCQWLGRVASGLEPNHPKHTKFVWDHLHPHCLSQALKHSDHKATFTIFTTLLNRSISEEREASQLLAYLIKLINFYFTTKQQGNILAKTVRAILIKRIEEAIVRISKKDMKEHPFLIPILRICEHLQRYTLDFPFDEFLDHLPRHQTFHWRVQLSLLYEGLTGQLLRIPLGPIPQDASPLDLVAWYEMERRAGGLPSSQLRALASNCDVIQRHVMSQGGRDIFDQLLLPSIPLDMRLGHLRANHGLFFFSKDAHHVGNPVAWQQSRNLADLLLEWTWVDPSGLVDDLSRPDILRHVVYRILQKLVFRSVLVFDNGIYVVRIGDISEMNLLGFTLALSVLFHLPLPITLSEKQLSCLFASRPTHDLLLRTFSPPNKRATGRNLMDKIQVMMQAFREGVPDDGLFSPTELLDILHKH